MNRSLFYTWSFFKKPSARYLILNFGPQHPAAHGVLRLILQLEGEVIQRADIHIGLLHRGTEFLAETKFYEQIIPYFDRLDYVSMMAQEHAYCLTVEYLQGIIEVNRYLDYTRILFDEMTRLLNHFLAIACHALDVGSMSSIFWAFEEREKLMEFYERISGARMHAAFHRPVTTFYCELTTQFISDLISFIYQAYFTLNEIHNVLTYNKIWKQRLINIGTLSYLDCQQYGLTGILLRSVGVKRDIRLSLNESYSGYNTLQLKSYIGVNGDTYDRYLIRMLEMGESLSILNTLTSYFLAIQNPNRYYPSLLGTFYKLPYTPAAQPYTSMEDLIEHFVNWHTGIKIRGGVNSVYIESPKGEFGVSLISNNTAKPIRCKIRSPSYFNLQALPKLCRGHYLADLTTLIGTIDIVFGEVDR